MKQSVAASNAEQNVTDLICDIKSCRVCSEADRPLQHEPNPIFQIHPDARLLIASQAPGIRAHKSGTPFMDPSGVRLRDWLQLSEAEFYDASRVAIVPMGFCFPGWDAKGGDLPPRKECAPLWRSRTLDRLSKLELTLLIGAYAQKWHLGSSVRGNLTETVKNWRAYGPSIIPLPHPSWRNNAWIVRNPWFESELLPVLKDRVSEIMNMGD